jgi:hypothetical protein
MIDGQIADGDYVVIRAAQTCENGQKVIAMVDKAMTLKKYHKKRDHIRLDPMNSTMEPILVDPTRQDVRILGVLAGDPEVLRMLKKKETVASLPGGVTVGANGIFAGKVSKNPSPRPLRGRSSPRSGARVFLHPRPASG